MRAMSIVGGVVPVPKAALLLRSSTSALLPSQCRLIPCRGFWFQIDGKSAGADSSFAGRLSIGKLKITFAELNVSTRPGPQSGCPYIQSKRPANVSTRSRMMAIATG